MRGPTLALLAIALGSGCFIERERDLDYCDGLDNDHDPMTEDGADDPYLGMPCDGPDKDHCAMGSLVCQGGTMVCNDAASDSAEVCNGKDDDCNGEVDELYDLATDPANCGSCNHQCKNSNGPVDCVASQCAPSCDAGAEDCNGNPDDGCEVFRDRNPTCSQIANMGAIPGDSGLQMVEFTGTDESILLVTLQEVSTGVIPVTGTIELDAPSSVNFDLYVYCGSCGGAIMASSTNAGGVKDSVLFRHEDGSNANDDQRVYIEVRFVNANSCAPWHLKVMGHTAVPSSTCGNP